mgnify:CR=1 FL=1
MKSIKELYRIGTGPSSSHTMGPRKAAEMFVERHPDAASFKVTLYGSLAATGKGHMTDVAIIDTLKTTAPVEIIWQPKVFLPFHPNGMTFAAFDANNKIQENWTVYSIGGGALAENNSNPTIESPEVYGMNSMTEILEWCERTGKSYWEYVKECENEDIWDYLAEVWDTMKEAIHRGLEPATESFYLLYTCYRIQTVPSIERTRILLCTGGKRGERFGGKDSNCPHLWFLRCHACRTLSPAKEP